MVHMSKKPEFVMGKADENRPKTITGILPLKAFLVEAIDGDSNKLVRIAFVPEGSETVFVLNEKITGQNIATTATEWFKEAFHKKLAMTQAAKEPIAQVGDDGEETPQQRKRNAAKGK